MNFIQFIENLAVNITTGGKKPPVTEQTGNSADFLVGISVEDDQPLVLDLSVRQHCYVIGSSGSGKTTLLRRLIESEVAECR